MTKPLFVATQYLLPHHLVSRAVGCLAASKNPMIKNRFIRWFIKRYQVDLSIAKRTEVKNYESFNDFFTRELAPGQRPVDRQSSALCSPADGAISQFGAIKDRQVLQAKGVNYSLESLLAGDESLVAQFAEGDFMTIYLSPKDYHRVHMPRAGKLLSTTYVPGRLFSVNPLTAQHVPGLFARNERLICEFETDQGPMLLILVGAMIVAGIETTWAGRVAPCASKTVQHQDWREQNITFAKGDEMGRFCLGSTVVMLFPERQQWQEGLAPESALVMGQALT